MKTNASRATLIIAAILVSTLLLCELALAAECSAPSFAAARAFSVPQTGLNSVAIGDFNGDGQADLVVGKFASTNISVLLGKGDGTFRSAVDYFAGINPRSVAVGDFNADSKLDVTVANSGTDAKLHRDGSVSVLLGKGDGTFQSALSFMAGTGPYAIAAGDLNGDDRPDLAVANADSASVSILLGKGDGAFLVAVNYRTGPGPESLAIGDFDTDGKADVVVANAFSDNASVLLGNGDGTFRPAVNYGVGEVPVSVAVADFNHDDKPDLSVAYFGGGPDDGGVSVLLGNGDGTFQAQTNFRAGRYPQFGTVGDFNGDNKPDLAVANWGSQDFSVVLGRGDGTFETAVNFDLGTVLPGAVAAGDLNGDGQLDLAVANGNPATVSVLLNTCMPAGPGLGLARGGNTVAVSWPSPSTGFVLESTLSLSPPDWKQADEVATPSNGRLEVTVSAVQGSRYFRLHKP